MESAPADPKPLPEKYQHIVSELEAKLDESVIKASIVGSIVQRSLADSRPIGLQAGRVH
jgi:hypothetical protein